MVGVVLAFGCVGLGAGLVGVSPFAFFVFELFSLWRVRLRLYQMHRARHMMWRRAMPMVRFSFLDRPFASLIWEKMFSEGLRRP